MTNLTTRKIILGLLMTLVLAFGVQDIADALRFTAPISRKDKSELQVFQGQTFDVEFTVQLETRVDVNSGTTNALHTKANAQALNDGATTSTTSTYNGKPLEITESNFSTVTTYYYLSNRVAVGDPVTSYTQTRNWVTEDSAFYYNVQAVTITPSAGIKIISINGYTTGSAAAASYTLNEDKTWGGTTTKELTSGRIRVKCRVEDAATFGAQTIMVTDATDSGDYPSGTIKDTLTDFTIYVLRSVPSNPGDIPTLSVSDGFVRHNAPMPISVPLSETNNSWYEVDFAVESGSPGTLYVDKDADGSPDKTASKTLTTFTGATGSVLVYLNPNRGTNKIRVTVAGRNPASTDETHSKVVTYLYGYVDLTADLTIEGPGGNGQRGVTNTRLPNPFVVKVIDGNNRGVSGAKVTFDVTNPTDGIPKLFPHSDFRAEPVTTGGTQGDATNGYDPLVVKTDRDGEAKVYLKLSDDTNPNGYSVTATYQSVTKTFNATGISATATRVLSIDTQRSDREQSTALLTLASKPLVVRVLAGGVNAYPGQAIRFTTTDGVLSPRREATQLIDNTGTDVPNIPTDRTILTNARGEAWIDYTGGNVAGVVTIWARAYTYTGTNGGDITEFNRIDSANTITFMVNVGGSQNQQQQQNQNQQNQNQQNQNQQVSVSVPSSVTGTADGTTTLSVTAPATAVVIIGSLNDTFPIGSASPGRFTGSSTSTLTLPSSAGTYTLTVFVDNTPYPVSVVATAAASQTGSVSVGIQPGSGAPGTQSTVTVTATDSSNQPANVNVTLSLTTGGGTFANGSTTTTVSTGTPGTGTTTLTRGSTPGTNYFITVSPPTGYTSSSPASGERLIITGTATAPPTGSTPAQQPTTPGTASSLLVSDGGGQSGTLNTPLADPLVVEVVDANDNPVANTRVRFRTTIGSGTFSPRVVRTDADGFAEVRFTPTSTGRIRVVATVTGVNRTAAFIIQGGDPADALVKVSGDAQRGTPGTALANPFVVEVQDADGEPLSGHRVSFEVTEGGGSLSETSAVSGANGRAQTVLTLGSQVGINSVQASVPGADLVTFSTSIEPEILIAASNRPVMYWIDAGALYRLAEAKATKVAESAIDVAVGGNKLYWIAQTSETRGAVHRANLDGTDAEVLQSLTSVPQGLALDTANEKLYLTNSWGKIQRMNTDGTRFETNLIVGLTAPMRLTVSGGNVYWTEAGGSIRFSNVSGPKTTKTLVTGSGTLGGIVSDANKVYWTEQTGPRSGKVRGANLDGTEVSDIYTVTAALHGLAIDPANNRLYWTNGWGKVQRARSQDVVTGLMNPTALVIGGANTATTPTTTPTLPTKPTTPTTASKGQYDVNGDGKVDNIDASLVAGAMNTDNAQYDVNGDGSVNFLDLLLVFDNRDAGAAGAPTVVGMKLNTVQIDVIEEQIDLLIATGDRSAAALRTLVYLQQLIATARPEKTQLLANYPNPFNPETWIPYELATDTDVRITIYNAQGIVIRTLQLGQQSAGYYTDRERAAYWDGRNTLGEQVASGVYFYQLETDEISSMRKMVILK